MISLNHALHVAVSVPHISRWQHVIQFDFNGVKRCRRATSARTPGALTCSAATLSPQQVQKRSSDGAEADEKGLSDYKVLCYRSAVERMVQCSCMSSATGFHCAATQALLDLPFDVRSSAGMPRSAVPRNMCMTRWRRLSWLLSPSAASSRCGRELQHAVISFALSGSHSRDTHAVTCAGYT